MFHKQDRWRHMSCLDIDIVVVNVSYKDENYTKLKVKYWNRNYNAFAWPAWETVEIQKKDFWKWKLIEGEL